MRYKIDYTAADKPDRWGHIVACALPSVEYAKTLADAEERARIISCKFKKRDVSVIDIAGPEDEGFSTWLVYCFRAGRRITVNSYYFKELGL